PRFIVRIGIGEAAKVGFITYATFFPMFLTTVQGRRPDRSAPPAVIEVVRPIPPLAFLPMFLAWFGVAEASKVVFVGYTTFFPMVVAIAASVLRVDLLLLRAAAGLGASRADLVRRVVVPASI